MIRNLICHVYPKRDGQKWRRTIAHLLQRRELFNGRRILTVATDDQTDSVGTVRRACAGLDAEIIPFRNNWLQESHTFLPALDMIANTNENEITFRCHAKGATHSEDDAPSHSWADLMFATNLDYPETIDAAFQTAALVGALRTFGSWNHPASRFAWHFSGAFYWFKHDRIFSRPDWRQLMPTLFGVEGWPGNCPREDSACLFMDGIANTTAKMYSRESWRREIVPTFDVWREDMRERFGRDCWLPSDTRIPTETIDLSIITSTWNRKAQLASVLHAFRHQAGSHKAEHIIVSDGPDATAEALCERFGARFVALPEHRGAWGCFAKDAGVKVARGRYVAFWDDDNQFYPDAIETLLAAADGGDVGIVQEDHLASSFAAIPSAWTGKPIVGDVDAMCFCVRRDLARQFEWADFPVYENDFHFIDRVCGKAQLVRFSPRSVGIHV